MRHSAFIAVLIFAGLAIAHSSAGQNSSTPPAAPAQPTPAASATSSQSTVLHANANLVLLDVVVTDHGAPVHDLGRNRFHVLEDGKEQQITVFEEHRPAATPAQPVKAAQLPPHTYTNAPLYPPGTSVNILLLDGLNTPVADQTHVRTQMIQYMGKIAPGTTMAVFTLSSRLRMMEGFTTDPGRLALALENATAMPRTSDVLGSGLSAANSDNLSVADPNAEVMLQQWVADTQAVQNDLRVKLTLDAFQQLALYLSALPGRKNVIWFSGSFPIALDPDLTLTNSFDASRAYSNEIRETDEMLAASRVSVYPVDARGLMNLSIFDASYIPKGGIASSGSSGAWTNSGGSGSRGRGANSRVANVPAPVTDSQAELQAAASEQASMQKIAKETGGKAYINTNGFKEAVADAVQNGSNYYTIAYMPDDKNFDGRFRKLQVRIDGGPFDISTRNGFFADPAEKALGAKPSQSNPFVTATMHGLPPSTQIIFNTRVLPATDPHFRDAKFAEGPAGTRAATFKGPAHRYIVDLLVDPRGVIFATSDDAAHLANLEFVVVAYDGDGQRVNYVDSGVHLALDPAHYAEARASGLPTRMEIDLPVGVSSLRIAVNDLNSGHIGALEVPVALEGK